MHILKSIGVITLYLVTLKSQSQGHSDFEGLYLVYYYNTPIGNHIWGVQYHHHL